MKNCAPVDSMNVSWRAFPNFPFVNSAVPAGAFVFAGVVTSAGLGSVCRSSRTGAAVCPKELATILPERKIRIATRMAIDRRLVLQRREEGRAHEFMGRILEATGAKSITV